MNDNLDTLSDAQLNDAFAVEVMTLLCTEGHWHSKPVFPGAAVTHHRIHMLCADANAVLPWLEKHGHAGAEFRGGSWFVFLWSMADVPQATAPTFARAAVIALLRAKRAQKGTP